jgi:ribosome maturation factor RimP
MTSPAQSIDELVRPLVTAAGLELWDIEVNPRMVRVLVDRPGGIDLTALTDLARAVSAALDEREDLTPGVHFELEVSSPGVERTLRTPSHFSRYVGTTVAVKTTVAVNGARRLQGVLLDADDTGITISDDDGSARISYDQIQKAHTVLMWGPTAKPTAAKKSMKGSAMKETAR